MIDDQWIREKQAVVDAATPGPWKHDLDCYEAGVIEAGVCDESVSMLFTNDTGERYKTDLDDEPWNRARESQASKDAAFIAMARTDFPLALAELRRLREALASLKTPITGLGFADTRGAPADEHIIELNARIDTALGGR